MNATNPYQTPHLPGLEEGSPLSLAGAARIRTQYLRHERLLRSSALLFHFASILCAFMSFGVFKASNPVAALVILAVGAVFLAIGIGLRKLMGWARVLGILASGCGCLTLLSLDVIGFFSAWIFYLLVSPKGRMVCSQGYRDAVALSAP